MNYKLRKQLSEDATNNSFEEKVAEVKQQLQNGVNPEDVFDYVGQFQYGFVWMKLGDKWNFINTDGNILREDLWFDEAGYFSDGFVRVKLNGKYNYLDTNGNLYDLDKNPINNINENRRRVVRITESQLRNTIKSVVTQYLNESRRQ